jgi:hypothetical protein
LSIFNSDEIVMSHENSKILTYAFFVKAGSYNKSGRLLVFFPWFLGVLLT